MKLSNVQLKLLIPIIVNAARETPSVELDEVIDRLIEMAQFRGMTMTRITAQADPNDMLGLAQDLKANRPERANQVGKRDRVETPGDADADVVHPLFRDPKKKKSSAA